MKSKLELIDERIMMIYDVTNLERTSYLRCIEVDTSSRFNRKEIEEILDEMLKNNQFKIRHKYVCISKVKATKSIFNLNHRCSSTTGISTPRPLTTSVYFSTG